MWTNIADPGISQQNDQWGMLGMVYGYDQLNRLVYANGYNGSAFNATNSTWSATETPVKYHNSFTYDANGNIFTQLRADQMNTYMRDLAYEQTPAFVSNPYYYVDPSTRIDQISYGYERNSTDEMESNRLYQVTDAINYGWDGTTDNKLGDIYDVNALEEDDINYTNNFVCAQFGDYGYTAIGELERDDAEAPH